MPADQTFTVKFKPEGDKELIQAINALARAQKKLETGQRTVAAATTGATTATKAATATHSKLNPLVLSLSAKLAAQSKTWKDLGVSTALVSKAMQGNMVAVEQLKLAMNDATAAGMFAVRNNRLLSNSFATLRSHLLLYAFGAMLVERAIVSMVKAYGQQEAANVKLQAGLANVQGTVKGVTQRLIDYSSALQKVTAFGDEVITTGMVQLTTFNLNEAAIKALTPQVLNVARAIQTAGGTMPELNSLFIAFGKSTSTAVSALTRYGVVLTDTEKKQLELMDANTRAIAVAEILEKQYGGIAEAYAKTTAGMLEATSAAFGDAKEAIGEAFAPIVLMAAEALKALAESIHPGDIKRWGAAIGYVTALIVQYRIATVAARIATVGFNLALAKTPVGLIAVVASVAIAQLLKLTGVFEDTSEAIKDATKKTVENVDATKLLTDEQIAGIAALEHRLKLLKEEDPVMKILIGLKYDWSEAEKKLAEEIVETTEALKAQAEAEREIKREAAKTQREQEAKAKREADRLDKLKPKWNDYRKSMDEARESHIHMQKLLKDYIATLDEKGIAHNLETEATMAQIGADEEAIALEQRKRGIYKSFDLVLLERKQLMDGEITNTEKLAMLDLRAAQATDDYKKAEDEFNKSGKKNIDYFADAIQAKDELNRIDRQRITVIKAVADAEQEVLDNAIAAREKLDAKRLSQNDLNLANMEYNALLDGVITDEEKLGILAKEKLQLDIELVKAIKDKDLAGQASLTARLNTLEQSRLDILKEELTARESLLGKLDEEKQKRLDVAQAALQIGSEMLGQFSAMTSAMGSEVNARMKNEIDALRQTSKYQRADSDGRKKMEKDVTDTFARERIRVARFEKAASFAQAGISIALAITKAIPNIILMGLIGAMGAVQLGAIASTPIPKYAQGGMIGGRRHSQGGTMINAEQGEFIMSRSAVESLGIENLNRMNEGGGGGTINVSLTGNVMTEEFTVDQVIPAIREALRRGENLDHKHSWFGMAGGITSNPEWE